MRNVNPLIKLIKYNGNIDSLFNLKLDVKCIKFNGKIEMYLSKTVHRNLPQKVQPSTKVNLFLTFSESRVCVCGPARSAYRKNIGIVDFFHRRTLRGRSLSRNMDLPLATSLHRATLVVMVEKVK